MKKYVFFLIFIASPAFASAITPRTAQYVCGRQTDSDATTCNSIIRGGYFDQYAAGECDTYTNQDETNSCMRMVRNHHYDHSAVEACDNFKDTSWTTSCLGAIADRTFTAADVQRCNAIQDAQPTLDCFRKYGALPVTNHLVWNEKARACQFVDPKGNVLSQKTPDDCAKTMTVEYVWVDDAKTKCGVYTTEGQFMDFADQTQKCTTSGVECLRSTGVLASTSTAMIDGTLYHLIPEIMSLPDNATVPADVYTKYSPDLIAASLVARLHNADESKDNAEHPVYDYKADTMIQMKFNASNIGPIKKTDGFLNQHQIDHSDGDLEPGRRAEIENTLIRMRLESNYKTGIKNPVNDVRPKYSFLTFQKDTNGQQRGHFSRQYGNVVAVFKDEIKDRATFTAVDSLDGDMDSNGNIVYGRVAAHTFDYRSTQRLNKIPDPNQDGGDYWEAQMWGNVSLHDVNYFLIDCPGDAPVQAASLTQLKATGIPIYKCEFVKDYSHFEKGALVSAGNPSEEAHAPAQTGTETALMIDKK